MTVTGARPDWGGNAQDWGGNCPPPLPHAGYGPVYKERLLAFPLVHTLFTVLFITRYLHLHYMQLIEALGQLQCGVRGRYTIQ